MKKLLITTDSFLPRWDGVARFLSDLVPSLDEYDITIVAPKFKGKEPRIPGVKIIRIPTFPRQFGDIYFSWPPILKLRRLVKKADIIFNQTIGPIGFSAIKAAKVYQKPVVSYVHSIEWELASKSSRRFSGLIHSGVKKYATHLYQDCTHIVVPTKEVAQILTIAGIKTPKTIVKMGVDTDVFHPAEAKDDAKARIGINPEKFVIGYHGRVAREKNLSTLRRSFRMFRRKYPNSTLLIVGAGPKDQMEELQGDEIMLVGKQDNVVPFLQAMDVYVLPSLTETTSLSTLEAMACGLPVVATPVGYVKEYIIKEITGLLFPRQSSDVLKRHLERLKEEDDLRLYLGRKARESALNKHKWDDTVENIKKMLTQVLVDF